MAQPVVLHKLRPYYGRIAVLESPVDQEERASGLVVPIELDGDIKRGVVLHIDSDQNDTSSETYIRDRIGEGIIVYFDGGYKIGDTYFVRSCDIIAYESGD